MSDSVLRQRQAVARRAIERRRDLVLLLGSLLLHVGVLSLLPGITTGTQRPVELLVEIIAAAPPAAAVQPVVTDEQARAIPSEPQATAPEESSRTAQAQTAPDTPVVREPVSQSDTTAAATDRPVPGPEVSAANEATPVVMTEPITAPESDTQVPREPELPARTEPAGQAPTDADGGVTDDESRAAVPPQDPPGSASAEPDDPTPVGPASSEEAPVAPTAGPPSPPPGPSEHELRLLGRYGDAARQRIRSQARNPEHGAEGVVRLEFEVACDGHLVDTWVFESSGHILLDNDALEAVRAAFNDAHEKVPFPSDVRVDRWVFQLALEYPLY